MPETGIFESFRLVVFDADDTLRQTIIPGKPCPHGPDEWVLRPGVREVLHDVPWDADRGPRIGLASNQDQVGYGFLSYEMAQRLLRDLAVAATGSTPAEGALQLCPHPQNAGCDCRKPQPRMLLKIMEHYGVDSKDTLFVGNADSDREAAARAGVTFMWAADLFG